jgi:hypothetical protein
MWISGERSFKTGRIEVFSRSESGEKHKEANKESGVVKRK